jgi:hypothetical protein
VCKYYFCGKSVTNSGTMCGTATAKHRTCSVVFNGHPISSAFS